MDDRVLLHQVHPLKLAADISASLISNTLLGRHRPVAGIVRRYALPMAASAIVLSFADVERLRGAAAGAICLPTSQASRRFQSGGAPVAQHQLVSETLCPSRGTLRLAPLQFGTLPGHEEAFWRSEYPNTHAT
jgi:hypothetical protein